MRGPRPRRCAWRDVLCHGLRLRCGRGRQYVHWLLNDGVLHAAERLESVAPGVRITTDAEDLDAIFHDPGGRELVAEFFNEGVALSHLLSAAFGGLLPTPLLSVLLRADVRRRGRECDKRGQRAAATLPAPPAPPELAKLAELANFAPARRDRGVCAQREPGFRISALVPSGVILSRWRGASTHWRVRTSLLEILRWRSE
jgi:hypothetical protein